MAAYSWSEHIKAVCRRLGRNGEHLSRKPYAEDVNGNSLISGQDPAAVAWSLLGANSSILYDSFGTRSMTQQERVDVMPAIIKRVSIMMSLYFKAGLPRVPRSHETTSLLKFGNDAAWPEIEKVLRDAYALAKSKGL